MKRVDTGSARIRPRHPARPGALVALALAAAVLAGCGKTSDPMTTGSLPTDGYRTKYPIVLAEGEEVMDIPVGMGSSGLGEVTSQNVRAFAAEASRRSTSTLVVLTPSGSANQATAATLGRHVRQEAIAGGMPGKLVELRSYAVADPRASAPIRLSYTRIKAISPECGRWTGQILAGADNDEGEEFGCATQANLAAMVSNPEDLITPRAQTPVSAARRYFVFGKWVAGEKTSSNQILDTTANLGGSE